MTRIGVTFGAFDLLHPGHIEFFKSCNEQCDELYVGLHVDPSTERSEKNQPVQTALERYIQLAALEGVSCVFPYETEVDLEHALCYYRPNVRFLGSDYEKSVSKSVTGLKLCADIDCEIIFVPRNHKWSSTELRERITSRSKRTKSPSIQ